jgi:hypothetical protein
LWSEICDPLDRHGTRAVKADTFPRYARIPRPPIGRSLRVGAGNEVICEQRTQLQSASRLVVADRHVEGVQQLDQLLALGLPQGLAQVGNVGKKRLDFFRARLFGSGRFKAGDLGRDGVGLSAQILYAPGGELYDRVLRVLVLLPVST